MAVIAVIGSGFSGISAAAYLAAAGHKVHVFEKNDKLGGRARQFTTESGYVFDMGPSWYWMPGVFEKFFNDFNYSAFDFYKLKFLDPSFEMVFGQDSKISIPGNFDDLCNLFESIEKGSTPKLRKFMEEAEFKYKTSMENLIYKPGNSITEYADLSIIKASIKLQIFSSFSNHVRKYFSNPKLIALMEFPVLFLGATPDKIPALYSLMNYAGLKLGTWYPLGGFGKVIEGMVEVARIKGTKFHINSQVEKIEVKDNLVVGLRINGNLFNCDAVVAAADYHHVESKLLHKDKGNYDDIYWEKKTFAPSCLIFYLGLNKRIESLEHHTLFFDESFDLHVKEIYKSPQWPSKPLFYVCCPSKSDPDVAPDGHENLFLLMPVAAGLSDTEQLRDKYFRLMMDRIEKHLGQELVSHIDYKRSYCVRDFMLDYNAYKGNAYGLANTLEQTGILKPKIKNKKIKNLVYAGQLTVPGPGVPPSIISGKIAADQLLMSLINIEHEVNI